MIRNSNILLFFILFVALGGCLIDQTHEPDFVTSGLKPVYGNADSLKVIGIEQARNIQNAGKIVYLSPYLFVNEIDEGIHIINNSNPENPEKVAFLSIPFNRDIAIKGRYIYADNMNDLISIEFLSADSIKLIQRQENTFDHLPAFPSDYTGYFECIDESKGDVIGWVSAILTDPKCQKF